MPNSARLVLLLLLSSLFFVLTLAPLAKTTPLTTYAQGTTTCTLSANKAQVSPGDSFDLTVNFSDGNTHTFDYTFLTPEPHRLGPITPNINPFTFPVTAPNEIFRSIVVRSTVGGEFTGCAANIANTTDSPSNECRFRTEPASLQNLDNADGELQIKVAVTSGPTGTYKATIVRSGSSDAVEESQSEGRPAFNFSIDAPKERGDFRLDVTGTRDDNGVRLDCSTEDGMLFQLITISSGRSPGVGDDQSSANDTSQLPDRVRRVVDFLIRFGVGIAGGVAFLLLIYGGFKFIFSLGNPENVQQGREIITAAIVGLIVVIFSVLLLRLIGISILGLPI